MENKIETRSETNMKFAPHFRIRPRLTTLHQKKEMLQGWSRVFNTDVPEIIISFVDHGDYLFWVTNLMMMSQYFSIRTWFGNKTWKWAAAPLPHHPTRACWRAFLLRILIVNILRGIFSSFLSITWVQLHTIIILTRPMVPFCTRINNLLKVFRIKKKISFHFQYSATPFRLISCNCWCFMIISHRAILNNQRMFLQASWPNRGKDEGGPVGVVPKNNPSYRIDNKKHKTISFGDDKSNSGCLSQLLV